MKDKIAHSADFSFGQPAQTYEDHMACVRRLAALRAAEMLQFYRRDNPTILKEIVEVAAAYHDLGKLDDDCQEFLDNPERGYKMLNHVDAGVAYLLSESDAVSDNIKKSAYFLAAILVQGHHRGLFNKKTENDWSFLDKDKDDFLRDINNIDFKYPHLGDGIRVCDYVDDRLKSYIDYHHQVLQKAYINDNSHFKLSSLDLRLLNSCLIDADHTDTAKLKGFALTEDVEYPSLRANERFAKLCSHKFSKNKSRSITNRLRKSLFEDATNCPLDKSFYLINTDVGSGKTRACAALALRLAEQNNSRRIFFLAPFVTIIDQTANLLAGKNKNSPCSLILRDELCAGKASHVVAAHHHNNDYEGDQFIKSLNVAWASPIVVTSVVQFFESLTHYRPTPMKKIHRVAGSVIVMDEFHCAVPPHLWQLTAKLMQELVDKWGCSFIFSSGSPIKFWDIKDLNSESITKNTKIQPEPIVSKKTIDLNNRRRNGKNGNAGRVSFKLHDKYLDPWGLFRLIKSKKGPRLVICNTIQNAAVLAHLYGQEYGCGQAEHLSTCLKPIDRRKILKRVKKRLDDKSDTDWALFATSCVEAGVDVSFPTGFTELRSLISLEQGSGRVNRSGEERTRPFEVFKLDTNYEFFNENKAFVNSRGILQELFHDLGNDFEINESDFTKALQRELSQQGDLFKKHMKNLWEYDKFFKLKEVNSEYRIIEDLSCPVYMGEAPMGFDPHLQINIMHQIVEGKIPCRNQHEDIMKSKEVYDNLMLNSCAIMYNKEDDPIFPMVRLSSMHPVETIKEYRLKPDYMYFWHGKYDKDCLGYMAEVLERKGLKGPFAGENVNRDIMACLD